MYGTSRAAVENVRDHGKICILDIDVQGVKAIKKTDLHPHYIFVKPQKIEDLENRLRGRKTETEESLKKRWVHVPCSNLQVTNPQRWSCPPFVNSLTVFSIVPSNVTTMHDLLRGLLICGFFKGKHHSVLHFWLWLKLVSLPCVLKIGIVRLKFCSHFWFWLKVEDEAHKIFILLVFSAFKGGVYPRNVFLRHSLNWKSVSVFILIFSCRLAVAASEIEYGTTPGNFDIVIENHIIEDAYSELRQFLLPHINASQNGEWLDFLEKLQYKNFNQIRNTISKHEQIWTNINNWESIKR